MYIYMVVGQNSFILERPFFANKKLLLRNFREVHVYLSRVPFWETVPFVKIHLSPAQLCPITTDHLMIAWQTCS